MTCSTSTGLANSWYQHPTGGLSHFTVYQKPFHMAMHWIVEYFMKSKLYKDQIQKGDSNAEAARMALALYQTVAMTEIDPHGWKNLEAIVIRYLKLPILMSRKSKRFYGKAKENWDCC